LLLAGASALQNLEDKGWQRPAYKPPPAARPVPVVDRDNITMLIHAVRGQTSAKNMNMHC